MKLLRRRFSGVSTPIAGIMAIIIMGGAVTHVLKSMGAINPSFWQIHQTNVEAFYILIVQMSLYVILILLFVPKIIRIDRSAFKTPKIIKLTVLSLCAVVLICVFYINLQYIVSSGTVRHSGHAGVQQLNLVFGLVALVMLDGLRFRFGKVNMNPILITLITFFLTIYPAATASRTSVVPFAFLFLLYTSKSKYLQATFFGLLSSVFMFMSLASRAAPSYLNFFKSVSEFDLAHAFDIILVLIEFSFPGSDTINLLLQSGFSFQSSILLFPLYLSPVPSSLLPMETLTNMSLSYPLGIDRESFSLNFDIFTEGYYWFGFLGLFIWPFFVVCLLAFPLHLYNSRYSFHSRFFASLIMLGIFYMFFGGMVFTLRAGTRFLFLIVILSILTKQVMRLKWR